MTKTISITNQTVLDALNNAGNRSELVTVAVLYYLGIVDAKYVDDYKIVESAKKSLKKEILKWKLKISLSV